MTPNQLLERTVPLTFTIDQQAIGLVADLSLRRHIGTAFSFVRPHWFVTAKHVVLENGAPRQGLTVQPNKQAALEAHVVYVHPDVDLAVLQVSHPVCFKPLFPAHQSLAGADGLIYAGYMPSKRRPDGGPAIHIHQIRKFDVQLRGRNGYDEETVTFLAPESEGGNSGGPIFGAGGGVVAVVIEHFQSEERLLARGTSLMPLVGRLSFGGEGY